MTRLEDPISTLRIGPGAPCADPLDDARAVARRDDDPDQGKAIARRLFVAFLVCLAIALACFVLIPAWLGVHVPAWVPLLSFLAIAAGAVLSGAPRGSEPRPRPNDDARPIGCCSGPGLLPSCRPRR